jgi:hypothetical protein
LSALLPWRFAAGAVRDEEALALARIARCFDATFQAAVSLNADLPLF